MSQNFNLLKYQEFNDKFKTQVLSREKKSAKDNIISYSGKYLQNLKNNIYDIDAKIMQNKYILECRTILNRLKKLNKEVSDKYADLLNTFSSLKKIESPFEIIFHLKYKYTTVSKQASRFINEDMTKFRTTIKSYDEFCGNKEYQFYAKVTESEKALINILSHFNAELQNIESRIKKSCYSEQTLSPKEVNYITQSSEFSTMIDYAELHLSQDLKISSISSFKHISETERIVKFYLENAELLLDSLSSLSTSLNQSDITVNIPIDYFEMEKQFMDLNEQFDLFKV